jgi:Fur family transcriptional regulator, zinc uptake regulator
MNKPANALHSHDHSSADALQAAVAMADEYCRERGQKLTPIRRTVLELLLTSGRATKAYTLLDEMRAMHPNASPPTVYRALDFLLEHGLIHRVERLSAFVGCLAHAPGEDVGHAAQFLICRTCGRVIELEDHELAHALADAAERLGFTVNTATIEAEGMCATCAARTPGSGACA